MSAGKPRLVVNIADVPKTPTYGQFGAIWINGRRLPEKGGESIEGYADKIVEIEQELKRERGPEKA